MTADTTKKKTKNTPPKPHKMEDLAKARGMTVEDFFISEVATHGSVRAAARANNMRPSSWQYWKNEVLKLDIGFRREVVITPKD